MKDALKQLIKEKKAAEESSKKKKRKKQTSESDDSDRSNNSDDSDNSNDSDGSIDFDYFDKSDNPGEDNDKSIDHFLNEQQRYAAECILLLRKPRYAAVAILKLFEAFSFLFPLLTLVNFV